MIEKAKIIEIAKSWLDGSDKFLVGVKVTPANKIYVDIDGDNGVTIDDCIELSRAIEKSLDRDVEDFELNVSSAGADSPLKFPRQYRKNVGRRLEVVDLDDERCEGRLAEVTDGGFVLEVPGSRKQPARRLDLKFDDVKSARVLIDF
ncbi:MAG: ribosome assembly cofactor RimP [Bacteroidales bacterium]|nr:ribosome assembly cofactor RimP [Bacteroidales bacterium]